MCVSAGTVLRGEAQDGGRLAFVPAGQLGEGHLASGGVFDHRGSCLDALGLSAPVLWPGQLMLAGCEAR